MSFVSSSNVLSRLALLPVRGAQVLRFPAFLLGFSILYFLAAKIGIATQLPPEGIVIIWPPNAIVLVTLLSVERGKWWLFFLATVSTEIIADFPDYPLWAATGYGVVNFLEAAFAAVLLTAFRQTGPYLAGLRHFLGFLVSGPLIASASAALIGAAIYKLGSPELNYLHYWRVFWFGDALGLLVVGTVLLSWRRPCLSESNALRNIEGVALALGWMAVTGWVFLAEPEAPRLYLLFPFLMWAALRFGVRGACGAVLATVVVVIWSAVSNVGPFATLSNVQTVISLQGLILVVAITTFTLAFSVEDSIRTARELAQEVEQRKAAESEVRQINHRLEEVNKHLDRTVASRTDELTRSLDRNKILLKELKHRVKNNLQVVSSLLGFHSRSLLDKEARNKLARVQGQIRAIAATYDLLHQTESSETVDFCKIVPVLCRNIASSHGELVSLSTETSGYGPVSADTAVALSLALNELITNSIKHTIGKSEVSVTCRRNEEHLLLSITDNGPGFPPGFDVNEAAGFGLRMARSLVIQAHGDWRVVPTRRGATIEILLPVASALLSDTGAESNAPPTAQRPIEAVD